MKDKIQKDLISAMKAHEKEKLDVIKLLKAAIQMEEINSKKELTDEEVMSIIVKQVKMRKDAISEFEKAGRNDLVESYNKEIDVLSEYLPKQLSEDEIVDIIDEAFKKINPSSQSQMGLIMKEVSPKLKNRADMGFVSKLIKERLS